MLPEYMIFPTFCSKKIQPINADLCPNLHMQILSLNDLEILVSGSIKREKNKQVHRYISIFKLSFNLWMEKDQIALQHQA